MRRDDIVASSLMTMIFPRNVSGLRDAYLRAGDCRPSVYLVDGLSFAKN